MPTFDFSLIKFWQPLQRRHFLVGHNNVYKWCPSTRIFRRLTIHSHLNKTNDSCFELEANYFTIILFNSWLGKSKWRTENWLIPKRIWKLSIIDLNRWTRIILKRTITCQWHILQTVIAIVLQLAWHFFNFAAFSFSFFPLLKCFSPV